MKDKHRDEFAPEPVQIIPPGEPPETQAQVNARASLPNEEALLELVPPGMLALLEKRMDVRINAALEAYKPEVAEAVKGAIEQVVKQAQAAGIQVPGVTDNPTGGGGVVPGSPVTPAGAELLKMIFGGGGGQGSQMEELAKTLTQARAISDVLNPPSIWDRVMQNAVLRSLGKAGLVTDAEVKELLEPPAKP